MGNNKTIYIILALAAAVAGYMYWKKHKRAGYPMVRGIPPMAPGGSLQQKAAAKKSKKGWRSRLGKIAKTAAIASGVPGAAQAAYVAGI